MMYESAFLFQPVIYDFFDLLRDSFPELLRVPRNKAAPEPDLICFHVHPSSRNSMCAQNIICLQAPVQLPKKQMPQK